MSLDLSAVEKGLRPLAPAAAMSSLKRVRALGNSYRAQQQLRLPCLQLCTQCNKKSCRTTIVVRQEWVVRAVHLHDCGCIQAFARDASAVICTAWAASAKP
jgi:hypothetical protein